MTIRSENKSDGRETALASHSNSQQVNSHQTNNHHATPSDIRANLRKYRKQRGHSLDQLAHLSGVSRAMLGQIETGKSVPTVALIWKVAVALGVPIAALISGTPDRRTLVLPKAEAKLVTSSGGRFTLRPFTSAHFEYCAGFFELRIASGHRETMGSYPSGTHASLAVSAGVLEIGIDQDANVTLGEGDGMLFTADVPQAYFNPGPIGAVAYLVISPARTASKTVSF